MDRNFTMHDLRHYLQEIEQFEKKKDLNEKAHHGPSKLIMSNLLRYSSALNILKTSSAGMIYQLTN